MSNTTTTQPIDMIISWEIGSQDLTGEERAVIARALYLTTENFQWRLERSGLSREEYLKTNEVAYASAERYKESIWREGDRYAD